MEKKREFLSDNPKLLSEWHPTKNGDLTLSDVTMGSNKKVWWKCKKGHEWEAVIHSRSIGRGCPICGKLIEVNNRQKNILLKRGSLQINFPNIAKQWHPTKNGFLTPYKVVAKSNKKVWWQCEKGHEWDAVISSRTNMNSGCPFCSQEHKTSFPEQAIYFYLRKIFNDTINRYKFDKMREIDVFIPSLNFGIEYDGRYYHGEKRFRFDSKKEECLAEKGIKLLRVKEKNEKLLNCYMENNVIYCQSGLSEVQLSDVIQMCFNYISGNITHETYNIVIDVKTVSAEIYELFIEGEKENSLLAIYPELANEWHPTKNGKLTPDMVSKGSKKKVWWLCKRGHEWRAVIHSRTGGVGCPYCSGKSVCADNCLQKLNPMLAKQWHPTKNGSLTPEVVTMNSNKKVWWICEIGHEYETKICHRASGSGCPYCAGQRVCKDNCLQTLNPNLAKQWHPTKNGILTPNEVMPYSNRKVWWVCEKGHEWESRISHRSKGSGCPFLFRQTAIDT